ncbi:hypothetical protein CAOG_02995 [Capsaspora owczarzaki ATCC 30864]|uniref:hypothetical protein n=1 Tax=Capsaspora owczarzaki (strain ATCC 30864) TaxID=595528 RepID=UPI0003526CD8|nr:hypothetical protein CAOG_02995 [Capsaspora owczarzaki ATCC 30864]|eukprot:XP_004363834.2 hypothetical protein CAOG_02995 [Capsaspora owczarzaki ATCC 30864]
MAAEMAGEESASSAQALPIGGKATPSAPSSATTASEGGPQKYGRPLVEVYGLALQFLRQNSQSFLVALPYAEKNALFAYRKQVQHGTYAPEKMPDVGFFDFVGKDQRNAWQALGNISREEAMAGVIQILADSDSWTQFVTEAIAAKVEEERKAREQAEAEARELARQQEEERLKREEAVRQQQRLEQLQQQQAELQQQQLKQQQLQQQQQQQQQYSHPHPSQQASGHHGHSHDGDHHGHSHDGEHAHSHDLVHDHAHQTAETLDAAGEKLAAHQRFVEAVRGDPDSVLVIGRGETATVRLTVGSDAPSTPSPSAVNGNAVVSTIAPADAANSSNGSDVPPPVPKKWHTTWEFATESYDIGFGVTFETNSFSHTAVTPILPTLRSESNLQVVRGAHTTDLPGVYLFKFDNSFSVFRSKTLYFRLYTQPLYA